MFELRFLPEASKQLEKIVKEAETAEQNVKPGGKSPKQVGLFNQVEKTLGFLAANPRHPGLKTHKYGSMKPPPGVSDVFEAYAQNRTPGAHRIFWGYGPAKNEITIVAITPHP